MLSRHSHRICSGAASLLLLGLLGCPRNPNIRPLPTDGLPPEPPPISELLVEVEEVGPGTWHGDEGLSLTIPEGWLGRTGPLGSPLLLELIHLATGTKLQLWTFEWTPGTEVQPRPRAGCQVLFLDQASHRSVPALSPATTATCVPDDPTGPTVQGWYGVVDGREVHLEVSYPSHHLVEARQAVEPLLAGLKRY